ncbi:LPS exporter LptE [Corallincola platygyrae]
MTTASCGFRLRGSYDIPADLKQVHVASWDEYAELTRKVEDRLKVNDVKLLKDPSKEQSLIILKRDNLSERTLSLFSDGQVAEYQLIYSTQFELLVPGKEPQRYDIEVVRQYQDDPNRALAKEKEKRLLVSEMRAEAADKILRTLASSQVR